MYIYIFILISLYIYICINIKYKYIYICLYQYNIYIHYITYHIYIYTCISRYICNVIYIYTYVICIYIYIVLMGFQHQFITLSRALGTTTCSIKWQGLLRSTLERIFDQPRIFQTAKWTKDTTISTAMARTKRYNYIKYVGWTNSKNISWNTPSSTSYLGPKLWMRCNKPASKQKVYPLRDRAVAFSCNAGGQRISTLRQVFNWCFGKQ